MKNRLNAANLVAILIAVLLFAIGIMLWVIHEQRIDTDKQAAHVAAASCEAKQSALNSEQCHQGVSLI
jgi:hypothetical protein